MKGQYDYDLALQKMSGLIHEAGLERAAAEGQSTRASRPGPRARVRAAFTALRAGDGTLVVSVDCLETVIVAHGRPA